MTERRVDKRLLAPVLMGFFIMGFCDIVAPISGRIATEFPASQQAAVSFLPTMVFLWFLVLSTPLAALMNRIGRKRTAMIGYAFTIAGLLVPYAAGVGSALIGISSASVCWASAIPLYRWRSIRCWRPSCPRSG